MYDPLKDNFNIENNIDYLNTKKEKELIDNFLLSIDTINYPYLNDTCKDLENISDRLFVSLHNYDIDRIKKINKL